MLRLSTALLLSLALPAAAADFRWAETTDPQTMDPHAVNSAPVLGFLGNVVGALAVKILGNQHSVEKQSLQKYIVSLMK